MKEHEESGEMEDGSEAILCREGDNHSDYGVRVHPCISERARGDIGLFMTLVPKVLQLRFLFVCLTT